MTRSSRLWLAALLVFSWGLAQAAGAQVALPRGGKVTGVLGTPVQWADLRLWPPRHVDSFPTGTTSPALAFYHDELLLVEEYQRALYLSRLALDNLAIRATKQLCGPQGQESIGHVDAAVLADRLWVTWISRPAAAEAETGGRQMFLSYDLQSEASAQPTALQAAADCALTTFGGKLWAVWRTSGPEGAVYLARYDTAAGLQQPQQWEVQRASWQTATAVDLGAELLLAGVRATATSAPPPAGTSPTPLVTVPLRLPVLFGAPQQLWAAKFNGQRFYDSRMLRGPGRYSSLTGAMLGNAVLLAYGYQPPALATAGHSNLDITLAAASGGEVVSTSYVADGAFNFDPDSVGSGDTIFVAFNKWSAPPGTGAGVINQGTFLGRIER